MLTHISLRIRFTDGDEVIVPLESDHRNLCCRPASDLLSWLDVGPGHAMRFAGGRTRTVAEVGVFRCLPPIVGARDGIQPTFPMTGREVIARAEEGRLVDWSEHPPRWRTEDSLR